MCCKRQEWTSSLCEDASEGKKAFAPGWEVVLYRVNVLLFLCCISLYDCQTFKRFDNLFGLRRNQIACHWRSHAPHVVSVSSEIFLARSSVTASNTRYRGGNRDGAADRSSVRLIHTSLSTFSKRIRS